MRKDLYCSMLILLSLLSSPLSAQVMPNQEDIALAKKYQTLFENSVAAAISHDTKIEFRLNKKNMQPQVVEEENIRMISLRPKSNSSRVKFYDDSSEIVYASSSNKKGKKINVKSICGNYESGSVFYSDAKVCSYEMSFVNLGEIKNFKIQKNTNDVKYFTSVYLTDIYPAGQRKISFHIPDWMQVELKEFNFRGYEVEKNTSRDDKNSTTIYEYTVKNIGAFQNESYEKGPSFTYPHILVLAKSFTYQGQKQTLLSSVDDLYKWYASLVVTVKNDKAVLEQKVKELTQGKKTDEEKIRAVYYWVQDNIRYIAFEDGIAGFKPEAAHVVYNNKYGDCKGMANLTKEMLKIAGYDARLTWIGTNRIAYNYSIPTLAVDNHMICTVLLNGKKIYLDGTEKFVSLHENAERIQGRQVLIENGEKFLLDSIPVANNTRNKIQAEFYLSMVGSDLKGKHKTTLNGEAKTGLLYRISNTPTDKRSTLLENVISQGDKNLQIAKLNSSNLELRNKPLSLACEITALNKVSKFEDEVYVELEQDYAFKDFTIKPERISDVFFNEKIMRVSKVLLTIPSGYKVSYLPKNFIAKHDAFTFTITYKKVNGGVQYEKQIGINKGVIRKEDFQAWNEALEGLQNAYSEKLVLKK
jgi:transglutaminase-like putative cysteine protease